MRKPGKSMIVGKVDMAALAEVLSRFLKDHRDKELLLTFGVHLLQHKINILEYAKLEDSEQEILEDLYQDVYRRAKSLGRLKKIFGFKRSSSIEEEARREAHKAVQDLKEELHKERFAAVERNLDQDERILEDISREFIEAIKAGRLGGKRKKEQIDRMRELLGGGTYGS